VAIVALKVFRGNGIQRASHFSEFSTCSTHWHTQARTTRAHHTRARGRTAVALRSHCTVALQQHTSQQARCAAAHCEAAQCESPAQVFLRFRCFKNKSCQHKSSYLGGKTVYRGVFSLFFIGKQKFMKNVEGFAVYFP